MLKNIHKNLPVACILTLLFIYSCKTPFATREPEKPTTQQSTWIQPTSPHFVIANLQNAIAEKNVTNYIRCLADTSSSPVNFRYFADPAVANANPGLFINWQLFEEQNYLNQLLSSLPQDSISQITFDLISESSSQQDSAILIHEYHLIVKHTCQEPECPRIMDGQSEFRFVRSAENLWYIYRWSDNSIGDLPTWSMLRAYFGK